MAIPVHLIKNADLVIYQPLSDVHNCYSTNRNNPESFFRLLNEECNTVSFPRIHNNAIFPMFHKNAQQSFLYGSIHHSFQSLDELIYMYDNNLIDYNFDCRMVKNYYTSKQKEADCDVKIADFIYENISNQKLFLTQDHPTSFVFNELTSRICNVLELDYNYELGSMAEENATGLVDSVYSSEKNQYPISRYAIRHFGFRYINEEDKDANEFYKNNTIHYYLNQKFLELKEHL